MYRYFNNNPHNRHIDDCTLRAISLLTNRSWNEVYEELSYLANKDSLMMDSVVFIEDYLDDKGKIVSFYDYLNEKLKLLKKEIIDEVGSETLNLSYQVVFVEK